AEQLSTLPAVVELDRQLLQAVVELLTKVVLDGRRRGEDEPTAHPDEPRLEQAEAEHGEGAPDHGAGRARGDGAVDDPFESGGDQQGDDGGAQRRERTQEDPGEVIFRVWDEARERPKQGEARGRAGFSISRHLSLERVIPPQKRDSLSA